ncbi:hypothetical protein DPMN_068091 [Dreissena polymorpha]|uniref:Uncharacterized protein n=1 Tax=Dreissena polymorpha TaxID=45954 RepID=A0A9D4BTB2_DREPO|nr:hypothetical protein DPMN_068091 [Dreissena polymorpha]
MPHPFIFSQERGGSFIEGVAAGSVGKYQRAAQRVRDEPFSPVCSLECKHG